MEELTKQEIKKSAQELIKLTGIGKEALGKIREEVLEFNEKGGLDVKSTTFNLSMYFLNNNKILTLNDTDEIYIYKEGVYVSKGDKILSKQCQLILGRFLSRSIVLEVLGHIRRSTYIKREEVEEPRDKICLLNGILDLEDLEVKQHTPDIIFFNKLPVEYNTEADCPNIKKFLSEVVKEEDINLIQEFSGYTLYKEYFIHKSFMLTGGGANGKSTYINLLKSFLGQENVASVPLQKLETNRFSISSLFGKLANLFADLPDKALSGTSIFKMLVGQDLIPAEKKFKDEFHFENYAKLIFSANQIPKSPEDTDAFFRRWIIINFPNQFIENADKHLSKKLTTPEELSGFLNFSLEGLKRILEIGDFSNTKSIQEIREEYIRKSDSVQAFIMDCIEIKGDSYEIKKKLYTSYTDYCRKMNYPVSPENTFHRELQKKIRVEDYRPSISGKREQCWNGIKLRLNWEKNPDNTDKVDNFT